MNTLIDINSIGYIESKYKSLDLCPANGWTSNQICNIIINHEYIEGLYGIQTGDILHVIWWFHKAPRNILKNFVDSVGTELGVFAMRSPHRPNPIALSLCEVVNIKDNIISVKGLEALDNSPVIDIKKAILYKKNIL